MKASRYSHKTNTTFSFLISIMTVVLMGVFMLCGPLTASAEQAASSAFSCSLIRMVTILKPCLLS